MLWHTEVEGEKPAAIAPLLGLTANGVSALAYRAREGLRQAYLQQHLAAVAGDRCRWTTERLGAYVRGGLTKRENRNVREHLDDCAKCTAVYLELVEVNSVLPALLAPALLGTAGLGYLTAASGPKVGLVGFVVTGWKKATENSTRTAVGAGAVVVVAVAAVLAAMALTGNNTPRAAISNPPAQQPTQPPAQPPTVPPVKPPTAKPPSAKPTTAPPATPTPPAPTTPIFDEGLLTISMPPSGGGPATRAVGTQAEAVKFVITITTPAGKQNPVVIGLKYGSALKWPLSGNPSGWTCTPSTGTCTATNSAAPAPLSVSFDSPTGGTVAQRIFTVSARTGRFYDDDSETLTTPPRTDENLLKIVAGKADPDVHYRILTVAPGTDRSSVTLKITYGASLEWPIAASPAGWRCSARSQTCTAVNPAEPAPLPAAFDVPSDGSSAARTFTVAATAGLVSDTDSQTVPGVRQDESLLQLITPTPSTDPNPFVYNRFLKVNGVANRRVTLEISWGRNLSFLSALDKGWTCSRSTDVRRATCWTDNYRKPFNSEWSAWLPGTGTANQLTVHASVGGREDTDSAQIPPTTGRR